MPKRGYTFVWDFAGNNHDSGYKEVNVTVSRLFEIKSMFGFFDFQQTFAMIRMIEIWIKFYSLNCLSLFEFTSKIRPSCAEIPDFDSRIDSVFMESVELSDCIDFDARNLAHNSWKLLLDSEGLWLIS